MMNVFRFTVGLMAGVVGSIFAIVLLLLASPWIFVLIVTRTLARRLEPKYDPWHQLVEFDPAFGWRTKRRLDTYHLADDGVYRTTTDAEGWRGKSTVDSSQILVFGDSYVFGHAIDDRDFFADLSPQVRIKAIGVSGYNMVQEFLWMQRLAPRMRGKLAVWFIYLGNDLTDTLVTNIEAYRIPFLREKRDTGQWEIVRSHLSPARWPSGPGYHHATFYERVAKLFVPGPFATRVYSACEFLITEADRVLREAGSRLVVVSIPSKNMLLVQDMKLLTSQLPAKTSVDWNYPDRQLREICQRLDVHFCAGKEYLDASQYRVSESHWNRFGHKRVSEMLAKIHSECGHIDSPVPTMAQ